MRRYDFIEVVTKEVVEWKCDVCGFDFLTDSMEAQEAVQIHNIGNYSSIFGDGAEIYLDMCQHCLKKILGQYINVVIED